MNNAYIAEENKKVNAPIWLYRIRATPNLYFTSQNWDVTYFRDNGMGGFAAQMYTPFADLSHEGIEMSLNGRIAKPVIKLANVSREAQALLELNNFFRGIQVDIWKTYRPLLADSGAHREFTFFVDSHSADLFNVNFNMIGKLDLLNRKIPGRVFTRKCSAQKYKGRGCWIEEENGAFTEPAGFISDRYFYWKNETTSASIGNNDATHDVIVQPLFASSLNQATDTIKLEFRFDTADPDTIYNAWLLTFYLGSGLNYFTRAAGAQKTIANWNTFLATTLLPNQWNVVEIPLDEFQNFVGQDVDVRELRYFGTRIQRFGDTTNNYVMRTRNIEFEMEKYSQFGSGLADSCDRTTTDCRRHNNVSRFFGFPNIPKRS